MTEKRYSDGTLAKWYYSRSNTICDGINEYSLLSKEEFEDINFEKILGTNDLLDELNRLSDENEELKSDNKEYIHGLDLSKATSQSWASDVRELREQNCQLEKENEQLQSRIQYLEAKIQRERNATTKQHLKWSDEAEERITELEKENEQLKSEINMLKTTIARNESYIKRLTHKSDWH